MTWIEVVFVLTACANAVAAVLAWVAKLRWSKEYIDATNRIIESKDQLLRVKDSEMAVMQRHVDTLQQLNPKQVSEWYDGLNKMFTAYSANLHRQLAVADRTINELRASDTGKDEELRRAREAYEKLSDQLKQIDLALSQKQLPDLITVVNSGTYSKALDESTEEFDFEGIDLERVDDSG